MSDSSQDHIPSYYRYWGKARPGDGAEANCHLLPYHSLDVAAVGWHLLNPEHKRCMRLAERLQVPAEWLQRWFSFFLTLHDIGKFSSTFQSLVPDVVRKLGGDTSGISGGERHDSLGYIFWKQYLQVQESIQPRLKTSEAHGSLQTGLNIWMAVVTGHHGHPPKMSSQIKYWRFFKDKDCEAAQKFFIDAWQVFTPDVTPLKNEQLAKHLKSLSWELAGVAVLADWLGSDQKHFPYKDASNIGLEEYWWNHAKSRGAKACEVAEVETPTAQEFKGIGSLFPKIVSVPTPLQIFSSNTKIDSGPQMYILEDVTGSGKTEAAMVLTQRLMHAGRATGLYVALPTMATANAMYERLGECYKMLFMDGKRPSLILAHGARELSEKFQQSINMSEQPEDRSYSENEDSASLYCNAWLADNRKKALLADVGIGTLDQALLAVLPVRHQSLRLLGLVDKVLLVDEVHAYDPYMLELLATLLTAHASHGGSAVLLSATLPQNIREKFCAAFRSGLSKPAIALQSTEYPLTTQVTGHGCHEVAVATRPSVVRRVKVTSLDCEQKILERIQQAVEAGQCVCWIRNTVRDARASHRLLQQQDWLSDDLLTLFHSRFAMKDRQAIESKVLGYFGKSSDSKVRQGRVLIATQVVEQSLDLDFDLMVSDLAPIDLLIQRSGRLHRHTRDDRGNRLDSDEASDQRGEPELVIFAPMMTEEPEEDWLHSLLPGTQAVYANVGQLWLSARLLSQEQGFSMPDDARKLIEGVYGDLAEDIIPSALQDASSEAEGNRRGEQTMALVNALHLSRGYTRESATSQHWNEEVRVPTRLGPDTVTVALARVEGETLHPYAEDTRFGWELSQIKLPEKVWESVSRKIPESWSGRIQKLKDQNRVLKWVDGVLPLVDETEKLYDANNGWDSTRAK